MTVVNNGVLTVPLYHGTCSVFIPSILQHGLGARNPLQKLGVTRFLRHGMEVCDRLYLGDPDSCWHVERFPVDRTLARHPHFRHGGVFLSASPLTAVRYACGNLLGSELLGLAATVCEFIRARRAWDTLPREVRASKVPAFIDGHRDTSRPVLIEAHNVRIESLRGEKGQPARCVIQALGRAIEELSGEVLAAVVQQHNFESSQPIPPGNLKAYEIQLTRDGPLEYNLRPISSGRRKAQA